MNNLHGSCMVNMCENFPLIHYSTRQLIKLSNITHTNIIDMISAYKDIEHFNYKLLNIILIKLKLVINN